MSRVQLALNVSDLEASVDFYSRLFAIEPHKRRPGYANFAISDPPLKLVLIEVPADDRGTGTEGALNHLGIEVEARRRGRAPRPARLREAGLATTEENDTTCCYALQDKVWVHDPAVRRGRSTPSRTTIPRTRSLRRRRCPCWAPSRGRRVLHARVYPNPSTRHGRRARSASTSRPCAATPGYAAPTWTRTW